MSEISETTIQSLIRIALSSSGAVIRLNTGTFYQGKLLQTKQYGLILTNIRPVKCGLNGLPDLMHLGNNGTVSFVECKKSNGVVSPDQKRFMKWLTDRKIRNGIARSVEDALEIIGGGNDTGI